MSGAFDVDEGPTQPGAAAPKTKTSRWRAVADTALERGFGRLSGGDFDQGSLPEQSGTHIVADRSESETLPAPEPSVEPAPPPLAPRNLGPRGTVRMMVPGLRGPSGTMRIAPVRAPRRVAPARPPWVAIASFALLSLAVLVEIPLASRPGSSTTAPADVAETELPAFVGPSAPPQPPADFALPDDPAPPVLAADAPRQSTGAAVQAPRKHSRPWWKHQVRTHRTHGGSNVL